jgi:hypothetical protein
MQTPKRSSSFIAPTKNYTSPGAKATPSPSNPSSFNTPYKKPQDGTGNFSTPFKVAPESTSFTTPFKSTPKDKPVENTDAKSSPRPTPAYQVKRKSLDFSDRSTSTEMFDEAMQEVSDITMVGTSAPERFVYPIS